ncbi:ABC transporter substrate-binding protein [Vibrio lentus]|uniref:ABC transporter substrate-binding protein n=1 Tax=Vibrio lentus TaxID=136468 RepID=UPI001E3A05F6|nr:ABC transporter substrate-binding protein [Vibrio lentus]MCC4854789.1 ABC transporter substrate-binding protein [Vibrio lentus]
MRFIVFVLSFILITPLSFAKSDEKHVILLLWRGVTDAEQGFMDYLSQHVDVRFTIFDANRDKAQLKQHIQDLKYKDADLIYSFGTTITLKLLGTYTEPSEFRMNNSTPVVFSIVTDPVGSKLIADLSSDDRNFTGVSHIVPHEIQFKAIEKLNNISSLGVIYNADENNSIITANKMMELSEIYNKRVMLYPLNIDKSKSNSDLINLTINNMKRDGVDMAYLPPDSYIITQGGEVVSGLHSKGIPTFSATESPIRNHKALFGIVSRYYNVGQFAGYKAKNILKGTQKASDIPIESLSQYSYIVNIEAAHKLDYYPPVSILKISEVIGHSNDVN